MSEFDLLCKKLKLSSMEKQNLLKFCRGDGSALVVHGPQMSGKTWFIDWFMKNRPKNTIIEMIEFSGSDCNNIKIRLEIDRSYIELDSHTVWSTAQRPPFKV